MSILRKIAKKKIISRKSFNLNQGWQITKKRIIISFGLRFNIILYLISRIFLANNIFYIGYGWQICSCCRCKVHIGWKYTSMNDSLKPDKFWGLTRNAIRYTYDDTTNDELSSSKTSLQNTSDTISERSLQFQWDYYFFC